jgi:hypothetical protein
MEMKHAKSWRKLIPSRENSKKDIELQEYQYKGTSTPHKNVTFKIPLIYSVLA